MAWSSNGRETWVLLDGDGTSTFSGSWKDAEEARRLRGSDGGPFLYVRTSSSTYVSRDPGLIARVRAEMKEQRELGEQQAALGARQAELGAQQGKLGAEQGRLGSQQMSRGGHGRARQAQAQLGALQGALAALEAQKDD